MRRAVAVAVGMALATAASALPSASQPSIPVVTLPPLPPGARVEVVDPCPWNFGQQRTPEQWAISAGTQAALMPTLGAAQQYTSPQLGPSQGTRKIEDELANPPASFGNVGVGGSPERVVVIVEAVGSPADLQRHADALTLVVPRPDRVVLCPIAVGKARRSQIESELFARFPFNQPSRDQRFYGPGGFADRATGRVGVHLRADGVPLAQELQKQYGDDIAITVGNFSWPDAVSPGPGPLLSKRCGVVPKHVGPKLSWKLPKRLTVKSGQTMELTGSFVNRSSSEFEYPRLIAYVTRPGSRTVIANNSLYATIAWAADSHLIQPGENFTVRASVGTDSCDANSGWALPPGRYEVYVTDSGVFPTPGRHVTSPPIPLTVTP